MFPITVSASFGVVVLIPTLVFAASAARIEGLAIQKYRNYVMFRTFTWVLLTMFGNVPFS